ncbi:hypothetical protein AB0I87_13500 [Streptomyces sp. NPDC049952]|uniref:hypothetical protein n=1 Tax=Streptomyces sp. NPDC049952 TaxID=3156665 RepID=UPI003435D775
MEPEMVAAAFGLGGTLVGAVASTSAVIWQQRKISREAERTHLAGLSEAAANECVRLSYKIQDHFAEAVLDRESSAYWSWKSEVEGMCRSVDEQALRFHDKQVRDLLARCHAEILVRPEFIADPDAWPLRYQIICEDIRAVMGAVLRRQPFPEDIWEHYPDPP